MIEIGSKARKLPAPPAIVWASLIDPHMPGTRPWLNLLDDEVEPRILDAEKPVRVVWSSLWPSRPKSLLVNPRASEQVPGRVPGKAAGGPDSGAIGADENAAGRRPGAAQPRYGGLPTGSNDQLHLQLSAEGSETLLRFILLTPDEPPDASKTGHLRRRVNHLLFADLRFSYGQ